MVPSQRLRGCSDTPWQVGGDFNVILCHDENDGGRDKPVAELAPFQDAVDSCGLVDLGFVGERYTWCNRWPGGETIYERLDRCLCNSSRQDLFPNVVVRHLDYCGLDHRPLELTLSPVPNCWTRQQHINRFEEVWLRYPDLQDVVRQSWGSDSVVPSSMSPRVLLN